MKKLRIRKLILVALCTLMAFTSLPARTYGDENQDGTELTFSATAIPSGKYGATVSVRLNIKNTGDMDVHDLWVTPIIDEAFTSAFEVVTESFKEKSYDDLSAASGDRGDSNTQTFSFKIRRDVKTGYFPINFKAKFKNKYDESGTATGTIYVRLTGKKEDEKDETKNINFLLGESQDTPYGAYPGVMDYSVNIKNTGINKAYDVEANMVLSEDVTVFPFEISLGNYDKTIGELGSGASVSIPYSMALREDVKTGYYALKFNITYREEKDGELLTTEEIFYVRTKGKEDEKETSTGEIDEKGVEKPRIIISGYTTDPEVVMSGEVFQLTIHMENTSKSITATNILFTLDAELVDGNAIFTPLSGSTAVVVDSMPPGSKKDITMPMTAKAGVTPKSYTLTVKEKYDVEKLKSIEDSASIAIPVKQVAKLSIGTVDVMPDNIEVGSESNIMFGINNTGKIKLYNVNVTFEADSIETVDSYVGNIEPGQTGNVDAMLSAAAPTMDDGKVKIIISYEDDAGVVSTVEKDLTLNVMEAMFPGDGDFGEFPVDSGDIDPAPSFFTRYGALLIAGGVIIIIGAAVTAIIIVRKRRAKKEEEGMMDEIS